MRLCLPRWSTYMLHAADLAGTLSSRYLVMKKLAAYMVLVVSYRIVLTFFREQQKRFLKSEALRPKLLVNGTTFCKPPKKVSLGLTYRHGERQGTDQKVTVTMP